MGPAYRTLVAEIKNKKFDDFDFEPTATFRLTAAAAAPRSSRRSGTLSLGRAGRLRRARMATEPPCYTILSDGTADEPVSEHQLKQDLGMK